MLAMLHTSGSELKPCVPGNTIHSLKQSLNKTLSMTWTSEADIQDTHHTYKGVYPFELGWMFAWTSI